jgi:chromosome segregation ATPase
VTITVTGPLAADMIGRGETERREREALIAELRERLDAVEAALSQKAAEQVLLQQHVEGLRGQLAQLGGRTDEEATQLRSELGRMRSGFAEAGDRFRELHGRLDRLEISFERLNGTVGGLEGAVQSVKGSVGSLEQTVERLVSPPPRQTQPLLAWRKGLHFWAAVCAVTLTATAVWIYA